MLKFTTTTLFCKDSSIETNIATKPLDIPDDAQLKRAIKRDAARIAGKALKIAELDFPCFCDGDITELDIMNNLSQIYMVIPSGHYRIKTTLPDNGEYLWDQF